MGSRVCRLVLAKSVELLLNSLGSLGASRPFSPGVAMTRFGLATDYFQTEVGERSGERRTLSSLQRSPNHLTGCVIEAQHRARFSLITEADAVDPVNSSAKIGSICLVKFVAQVD